MWQKCDTTIKELFSFKKNKMVNVYIDGELMILTHVDECVEKCPDCKVTSYSISSGQYFISVEKEFAEKFDE